MQDIRDVDNKLVCKFNKITRTINHKNHGIYAEIFLPPGGKITFYRDNVVTDICNNENEIRYVTYKKN